VVKIFWVVAIGSLLCGSEVRARTEINVAAVDAYIVPYLRSNNFSGAVLVKKKDHVLFEKSYGFSDRERRTANTSTTRFHIASISMQYTAAAILRLIDQGALALDTHVNEVMEGIEGGDKITIRDLLLQRSGLPDINDLPAYDEILKHNQTPATLVAAIKGRPLRFQPGSTFLHEEHSAYNLLALIVETKARLPFASAMDKLVFRPAGLSSSGVDDDSNNISHSAKGYQPAGVYELKPAAAIHWSAKSGNASVFTTARDHARFVDAIFNGDLLKPSSRALVADTDPTVGYGWFRSQSKRFHQTAYYINGRSPGFASFVTYLPAEGVTVIVFSNIYSSATSSMGDDIAAITLGVPYEMFRPAPVARDTGLFSDSSGTFKFGPDFYQPNAELKLVASGDGLFLQWPSETTALIPLGGDHFVDRSYWIEVRLERDSEGTVVSLSFDHFRGTRAP
jgi:CubicO group peptidase (beta-lactamase class C family)